MGPAAMGEASVPSSGRPPRPVPRSAMPPWAYCSAISSWISAGPGVIFSPRNMRASGAQQQASKAAAAHKSAWSLVVEGAVGGHHRVLRRSGEGAGAAISAAAAGRRTYGAWASPYRPPAKPSRATQVIGRNAARSTSASFGPVALGDRLPSGRSTAVVAIGGLGQVRQRLKQGGGRRAEDLAPRHQRHALESASSTVTAR